MIVAQAVGLPGWASGIASFVVGVVFVYVVARVLVKPVVFAVMQRRSTHLAKPASRFVFYVVVGAGVLASLDMAGYSRYFAVFGAVAAAGTFAVGFAMKDTLSAFVSGIFLFVDKPFQIGDWIEFDAYEGVVDDITLRTTKIETFNSEMLTVPNDKIANAVVKNPVANNRLRVVVTFGIGYDDDVDQAKQLIRDILDDIDGVASSPEPVVRLTNLGESTVDLKAFYWIKNPRRATFLGIKEELLQRVKDAFEAEGIDLPYPTQTIAGDRLTINKE